MQDKKFDDTVLPSVTVADMLDAGVHFGHRIGARHPKMNSSIYKQSHGVHIINVHKSRNVMLHALKKIYQVTKSKNSILFVSTSSRFKSLAKNLAESTNQHYVCKWLGGMLTNWRTIVSSVKTLRRHNELLAKIEEDEHIRGAMTKKEIVQMQRHRDRLDCSFGGMINISGMPSLVVVLSVKNEQLAIAEANCVGIPVVGIVDTNVNPDGVMYAIPGNDDSIKSVKYYCSLFYDAALAGIRDAGNSDNDSSESSKGDEDKVVTQNVAQSQHVDKKSSNQLKAGGKPSSRDIVAPVSEIASKASK